MMDEHRILVGWCISRPFISMEGFERNNPSSSLVAFLFLSLFLSLCVCAVFSIRHRKWLNHTWYAGRVHERATMNACVPSDWGVGTSATLEISVHRGFVASVEKNMLWMRVQWLNTRHLKLCYRLLRINFDSLAAVAQYVKLWVLI